MAPCENSDNFTSSGFSSKNSWSLTLETKPKKKKKRASKLQILESPSGREIQKHPYFQTTQAHLRIDRNDFEASKVILKLRHPLMHTSQECGMHATCKQLLHGCVGVKAGHQVPNFHQLFQFSWQLHTLLPKMLKQLQKDPTQPQDAHQIHSPRNDWKKVFLQKNAVDDKPFLDIFLSCFLSIHCKCNV